MRSAVAGDATPRRTIGALPLGPQALLALQRSAGNRAVAALSSGGGPSEWRRSGPVLDVGPSRRSWGKDRGKPGVLGPHVRPGPISWAPLPGAQRLYDPSFAANKVDEAVAYVGQNRETLLHDYGTLVKEYRGELPARGLLGIAFLNLGTSLKSRDSKDATGLLLGQGWREGISAKEKVAATSFAVRVLNFMEQELVTSHTVEGDISEVVLGTEFSFTDGKDSSDESASINLRINDDDEGEKAKKGKKEKGKKKKVVPESSAAHEAARVKIAAWAKYAAKNAAKIEEGATAAISKPKKSKATYAQKVTYTFADETSFWWVADIDEGCYETQTEKSQAKELTKGRTRKVIDQHIFGWASDNGLSVDRKATGGGGHLSVDLASGFGTSGRGGFIGAVSVETLLSTLLAFQEEAGALSYAFNRGSTGKKTDKDVGEADVTNAPWLTDQELRGDTTSPLSEYRKVINGLVARVNKGDLIGLQAVTAKLVAFNQRLTNPKVTEETRKAQTEAPENISHYQAVNIEHVFSEEEEEGDRRIEVRDIPAQADAAMLERDIGALLNVVQLVRDSVKASLRERITKPKKRR